MLGPARDQAEPSGSDGLPPIADSQRAFAGNDVQHFVRVAMHVLRNELACLDEARLAGAGAADGRLLDAFLPDQLFVDEIGDRYDAWISDRTSLTVRPD